MRPLERHAKYLEALANLEATDETLVAIASELTALEDSKEFDGLNHAGRAIGLAIRALRDAQGALRQNYEPELLQSALSLSVELLAVNPRRYLPAHLRRR